MLAVRNRLSCSAQCAEDRQIHLFPTNPKYRESINAVASDAAVMYPGEEISDWHTYQEFGTRLSESLLLSLGYFSDEELQRRRDRGQPLPPASLWINSNMRRRSRSWATRLARCARCGRDTWAPPCRRTWAATRSGASASCAREISRRGLFEFLRRHGGYQECHQRPL